MAGREARADYARTLLSCEEKRRFTGILLRCLSVSPLQERIHTIMLSRKATKSGAVAAVAVFLCVSAVFATSPGAYTATVSTYAMSASAFAAQSGLVVIPYGTVYVTYGGSTPLETQGNTGIYLPVTAAAVQSTETVLPSGISVAYAVEGGSTAPVAYVSSSYGTQAQTISDGVYTITRTSINP
jgi:hypothetical protein